MDELHIHTVAGVHKFYKPFRPFQKPRCQKSEIKEVHNLKFRYCLRVVAHKIWKFLQYACHFTQSWNWLSSLGTIEMQSPHAFWKLHTLTFKAVIMGGKDIPSSSKSVAWYQKYVHIKACLATGFIARLWRQVKMMFIPATGKVNYTQANAYCPISLLPFKQKITQKFQTRNVGDETLGNVTYIYNNLTTNQVSTHKPQCTMWLHTYRKQWKTGSYAWAFLDIVETSDSTSHNITKAAKWHGITDTL
jgi:hypothetical protein